jgi:hypothetical protein
MTAAMNSFCDRSLKNLLLFLYVVLSSVKFKLRIIIIIIIIINDV